VSCDDFSTALPDSGVKITTRQLEGHLKKGLGALYAIHGAEPLLALEAADRIREAARRDGCTEREIFFAEPGVDWNRLAAAAANLSLFASKRLVELRIPTGKPGAEGGRAIEAWCEKLPGDAVTLVLLPELEWQSLKTQWFAALERSGTVVEAKPVTRDELPEWLAGRLARQDQRASVETLEWLAERVEGNLLAAKQEVEKLSLLLPSGEITLEAIRDAVTDVSRFERDTLVDAIHAGEASRIARAVASLEAEGEPLPLLLWTLAEELRLLMAIAAGQRPRRFLPPDRVEALNRTAKKHTAATFGRELLRAHRIDRMIKGVETGDPWASVVELALGLAGRPVLAEVVA
jgi:DNA polymerase III subunit delta